VAQLVDMTINPGRVIANAQHNLYPLTFAFDRAERGPWARGVVHGVVYAGAGRGLGLECKVGWFERPERLVVLIVAGFFGLGPVIPGMLIVLVVFSYATAIQRMVHVWKITRSSGSEV
jgi:hypothetical protein